MPEGTRVEISEFLGEGTNNQAEYRALLRGLEECAARGITRADFYLDSELVVKQVKGEYRVKQVELLALHRAVRERMARGSYQVGHVGREGNRRANVLAQNAARSGPAGEAGEAGGEAGAQSSEGAGPGEGGPEAPGK